MHTHCTGIEPEVFIPHTFAQRSVRTIHTISLRRIESALTIFSTGLTGLTGLGCTAVPIHTNRHTHAAGSGRSSYKSEYVSHATAAAPLQASLFIAKP
jgi:hypothetical protein